MKGAGGGYRRRVEVWVWAHQLPRVLCSDRRLHFTNEFISGDSLSVAFKSELKNHLKGLLNTVFSGV